MIAYAKIIPDTSAGEPRRRETRVDADADIGLRPFGALAFDARLINVSSRGFMAECDRSVARGMRVWVSLPGIARINAEVIWSKGCRFGGSFAEPIDPLAVLQAIGQGESA